MSDLFTEEMKTMSDLDGYRLYSHTLGWIEGYIIGSIAGFVEVRSVLLQKNLIEYDEKMLYDDVKELFKRMGTSINKELERLNFHVSVWETIRHQALDNLLDGTDDV